MLIGLLFGAACSKNDNEIIKNAEIIGFDARKCSCCWGWEIKIGNDTIKSDNIIIGEIAGYDIEHPIKVNIKLGDKQTDCHLYYDILSIEKIEN